MKRKNVQLITVVLALAGILGGCGSSKMDMSETAYEAAYDAAGYDYVASNTAAAADYAYGADNVASAEAEPYYEGSESGELINENGVESSRKLIKTVDMNVETENYDNLLINLAKQIRDCGGYIEYQYEYNGREYSTYDENRNANWEIRIPSNRLDEFVVQIGEETNIINKTERITDVTLQYVDLESHKTALLTEQKRLLELLEQAETVEDTITIEQRLSEVRYSLESMESQLRLLDNQIDYSTINLSIQEVKRVVRVEENSVWDRIRNGFAQTIYDLGEGSVDFFVWFVVNIPYLVIWAIVIIAVVIIIRFIRKKRRAKKQKKMQQAEADSTERQAEAASAERQD